MRMLALAVPLLVVLTACALPAEHTKANLPVPAVWTFAQSTQSAAQVDVNWWGAFGSDELTVLVQQAAQGNFDLASAAARVRQAQALARFAGAPLWPDVNATVSAVSVKEEEGRTSRSYAAGMSASYELDLWGGLAAERDAAGATLAASEYARDSIALILTTAVASTYFEAVALRERVDIARLSLATSERFLSLVESRARAGAATHLELAQQRGLVATQRQALAHREQQAQDSLTALAILLGRAPQGMDIDRRSLTMLAVPSVSAGVPADLLVRRPDLAQAERALAAADANVAAARAAMLPALTLTAGVSVGSSQWRGFFDTPLYSLAAGLVAPIFNAGRLAARRDLALAQREELLANYRAAIVNALGDVEIALNGIQGIDMRAQAQAEALAQAQTAVRLAESRYRSGAEALLIVLDAQRTLYATQDELALLALARLQVRVALFKALGGGWRAPEGFRKAHE